MCVRTYVFVCVVNVLNDTVIHKHTVCYILQTLFKTSHCISLLSLFIRKEVANLLKEFLTLWNIWELQEYLLQLHGLLV